MVVRDHPGVDSFPEKIAGASWYYDPDHTFFYSRGTLSETLAKAGFEILADGSYVGAGHETCDAAWVAEGFGPTFTDRVAQANRGDVLLMLARKPTGKVVDQSGQDAANRHERKRT